MCAWVLAPHGARAQAIDQYLNLGIPGFDSEAGVTVTSRAHPEFDPPGWRVGNVVLTPVLAESVGYDDNVTGTQRAHGSSFIETNATLGATDSWSDTTLAAALTVDDYEYFSQPSQSYTDWTASAGASHAFGRDVLSVGFTHQNLVQTSRGLDVPGLTSAAAYRVDELRANYHVDLGHIFIQPGVTLGAYSFDNGTTSDGQAYLQSYRDRLVATPEVIGSYEFATRRRVVVILRDTQSDFDSAPPGLPRQSFNDVSALGGLAYDADGIIGFRLLGGYERRAFSNAVYRTIEAPILEGSVTWTPTGLTTLTGTAARYIEDSAAEATTGFTETALKLQVDHELLRNVILTLHGAYYIDDYDSSPAIGALPGSAAGSQTYVTGGLTGAWALTRNIRVMGDYTYSTRNSDNAAVVPAEDGGGGIFGGNYAESVFRVTLRVGL